MSVKRETSGRIVIFALLRNARIHAAINDTLRQIDAELLLARQLADETHFEVAPGINRVLPHKWITPSAVHPDVKEYNSSYEFIDAAFRPDTERLLGLMAGVALYASPFAAVRELLENAFDAVREQTAWQLLAAPDSERADLEDKLGGLHRVELRYETSNDGALLACSDTGTGMNKEIIRDYLLVTGSVWRPDVLRLERRAADRGFSVGRTGRSGVGVLKLLHAC